MKILISMMVIAILESSGNPSVINFKSKAYGLYQLTKPSISDYNMRFKASNTLLDALSPVKATQMATWYMNVRIPELLKSKGFDDSVDNRLISWNCGISCVNKKLPKETVNFITKYHRLNGDL